MKKIPPKEVVHDDEEVSAPSDRHASIHDHARRQYEAALKKAMAKHRLSSSPVKQNKHRVGNEFEKIGSVHSVEESIEDSLDQILSEKLLKIMEGTANGQIEDNKPVVSPDVKPTGKTPVNTGGSFGMSRQEYQDAQGIKSESLKEDFMQILESYSKSGYYTGSSSFSPPRSDGMLSGERRRAYRAAAQSKHSSGFTGSTRRRSSPKPAPKSEEGFYPMKVKFDDREKAKSEGMKWHPDKKVWYHEKEDKASSSSFKRHE